MSDTIRVSGNDLIVQATVIDGSENPVTAGQTVKFVIFDYTTGQYWDGAAFASGSPVLNDSGGHSGDGVYEYALVGGWDGSTTSYRVRPRFTGVFVRDPGYGVVESLSNATNVAGLTIVGGVIDANLVKVNGLTTADGVSFNKTLQKVNGMADGRQAKDVPSDGHLTTYERDNVTPLSIVKITEAEITREL